MVSFIKNKILNHPVKKIYNLVAEIYDILGNKELSKKITDPNLRLKAVSSLKDELSGIRLPSSYLS